MRYVRSRSVRKSNTFQDHFKLNEADEKACYTEKMSIIAMYKAAHDSLGRNARGSDTENIEVLGLLVRHLHQDTSFLFGAIDLATCFA